MTYTEKIVEYFKYCKTCKHKDVKQEDEPCNSCLYAPVNEDSVVPVNYEKKE